MSSSPAEALYDFYMENANPEDLHRFLDDEREQIFNETVELIKQKGHHTEERIKEYLAGPWNVVTTDDPCDDVFEEKLTSLDSIELTIDALSKAYAEAVKSLPREQAWVFLVPSVNSYTEVPLSEVVEYVDQALSEQDQ